MSTNKPPSRDVAETGVPPEPQHKIEAGPAPGGTPPLGAGSTLARLLLIGCALAAVVAIFAYFGGWLTPNQLTDGLEQVAGVHPGFRRNHAKGMGVSGFFESNGIGERLSKAAVFRPGRVPVIGRFSLAGPNPLQ